MAAEVAADANSSHPDPNGLRQEPRVVLSFTPVASAVHLVAGMAKSTFAAVSDLAGVMSPVGFDLSDLGFDPPPGSLTRGPCRPGG